MLDGITVSSKFPTNNGTKQGGVLSPYLFTRYVRNSLTSVAECGIGCCVGDVFTNIFSYADDMILLATSWSAMQQILELLEKNCITYSILCNTKETVCMVFNPKCASKVVSHTFPPFTPLLILNILAILLTINRVTMTTLNVRLRIFC